MRISNYNLILLIIFFITISCSKNNDSWTDGPIVKEGNYRSSNVEIIVRIKNNLVDFKVMDTVGNLLLESPHEFSTLHKWALYFDKDESLWVLSSDIGCSIFRKDLITGKYKYSQFPHFLRKDDVPDYMYDDLRDFVSLK